MIVQYFKDKKTSNGNQKIIGTVTNNTPEMSKFSQPVIKTDLDNARESSC